MTNGVVFLHNDKANPDLGCREVRVDMAYVKVDDNEPLEKSIKRFKRMVESRTVRTRLLLASR